MSTLGGVILERSGDDGCFSSRVTKPVSLALVPLPSFPPPLSRPSPGQLPPESPLLVLATNACVPLCCSELVIPVLAVFVEVSPPSTFEPGRAEDARVVAEDSPEPSGADNLLPVS